MLRCGFSPLCRKRKIQLDKEYNLPGYLQHLKIKKQLSRRGWALSHGLVSLYGVPLIDGSFYYAPLRVGEDSSGCLFTMFEVPQVIPCKSSMIIVFLHDYFVHTS